MGIIIAVIVVWMAVLTAFFIVKSIEIDARVKEIEQDNRKLIERFAELVSKTRMALETQQKSIKDAIKQVNELLDAIEKLGDRISEIQDGKK